MFRHLFNAVAICVALNCVVPKEANAADQLKMTFAMPTTAAPYLLPFFVAQDLGWYEKAGLKVEERVVTGDTNCLRAVLTGDADTTYIGPNTIMQGFVSGGQVRIIGSLQPVVDYRVVARKDAGNSLKELADKRWAISSVGGMLQALPKMVMKKYNIESSGMKFISVGGYAARYQALLAGTVDASLLDTMLMLRGEKEGKLNFLGSVTDDFPKMGFVFFPVRTSALNDQAQRKALQIFMAEGIKGVRYIVDHPREAAEVMTKRLKTTDVDGMVEVVKEMSRIGVWGLNGGLDRDVYEFSENLYRSTGEVTAKVPYEAIVDTSLVDESLKELGKR